MSDLISLASAYRNAEVEYAETFDAMERAQTAYKEATAQWEAAGDSLGAARKALLSYAASGIETEGEDAEQLRAEHESPTAEGGDAIPSPSEPPNKGVSDRD